MVENMWLVNGKCVKLLARGMDDEMTVDQQKGR